MKWEFLLLDVPILALAVWQLVSLNRLKREREAKKLQEK